MNSPTSYIEVTGVDGAVYHIPFSELKGYHRNVSLDHLHIALHEYWREHDKRSACGTSKPKLKGLLINGPWATCRSPSLQLGIVKSYFEREKIHCSEINFNLFFADWFGLEGYEQLATYGGDGVEWVFSHALHGEFINQKALEGETYLDLLRKNGVDDWVIKQLVRARGSATKFVEFCVKSTPWEEFDFIGLTNSLRQNVFALALAQMVKDQHPNLTIVFGGASSDSSMGIALQAAYPFIDVIVRGEFEPIAARLASALQGDISFEKVPSISFWEGGEQRSTDVGSPFDDLDDITLPDYSSYSDQIALVSFEQTITKIFRFEASRGCWWGEKSHCTFCGLNALGMVYRRKTPQKVLRELDYLFKEYGVADFFATDNILDFNYFGTFLPRLRDSSRQYNLFFELKTNVTREQVRMLAKSGVKRVQPGVESLITPVLKIMGKGNTGISNLMFLRRCAEFGIDADWNFLYGFAKEPKEEYGRLAKQVKNLYHLQPPSFPSRHQVHRFSPNFYEPTKHGLRITGPRKEGYFIYNVPDELLTAFSYTFDYELLKEEKYDMTPFFRSIETWRKTHRRGSLTWTVTDEIVKISDSRYAETAHIDLGSLESQIYRVCESPQTIGSLYRHLANLNRGTNQAVISSTDFLGQSLELLTEPGLLFQEGGKYLSLGIPSDHVNWTYPER